MARAVLILGGNQGDVERSIGQACDMISLYVGDIEAGSSIYRSEAWGFEGDDFLNRVLVVNTELSPEVLLDALENIEEALGRDKAKKGEHDKTGERVYYPRTMDIDILFYDDICLEGPRLTIPHAEIARRRFVLEPLCEVMPRYVHPVIGCTIEDILEGIK